MFSQNRKQAKFSNNFSFEFSANFQALLKALKSFIIGGVLESVYADVHVGGMRFQRKNNRKVWISSMNNFFPHDTWSHKVYHEKFHYRQKRRKNSLNTKLPMFAFISEANWFIENEYSYTRLNEKLICLQTAGRKLSVKTIETRQI